MNLSDWLEIAALVVGVVIWLIRLEGKVKYLERDLDILTIKHNDLDSKLLERISKIEQSLARIEGRLGVDAISPQ